MIVVFFISTETVILNHTAATLLAGFQTELTQSSLHPISGVCRESVVLLGHSGCFVSHLAACAPIACQLVCGLPFSAAIEMHLYIFLGMSQDHMTETRNDADAQCWSSTWTSNGLGKIYSLENYFQMKYK